MNWKDPENSSLPHPAVQHLQTEELKVFVASEDDIITLLQHTSYLSFFYTGKIFGE